MRIIYGNIAGFFLAFWLMSMGFTIWYIHKYAIEHIYVSDAKGYSERCLELANK